MSNSEFAGTWVALKEGEEVYRGSYEACMRSVGANCDYIGWYIPSYKDADVRKVSDAEPEV